MGVGALSVNCGRRRRLSAWLLACCTLAGAPVGAIGGATWQVYSPEGASWQERPEITTREVSPPYAVDVPSIVSGTGQGTRVTDALGVVAEGAAGRSTRGPIDDLVLAMAADARGGLWVATTSGLSRFDGQSWMSYTRADGLADDFFSNVAVDRRGDVWAVGPNGVTHFDGKRWTHRAGFGNCHGVAAAPNGDIWVLVGRLSAYRFDGVDWWRYGSEDGLVDHPDLSMRGVVVDHSGLVWVGFIWLRGGPTYNLASFDGKQWVLYEVPGDTNGLHVDLANRLWVGTDYGLACRDDKGWAFYGDPPFCSVQTLAEDRAGRLWVCGGASGEVGILHGSSWTSIALDEVAPGPIAVDARGDVWLSGDDMRGVARWHSEDLPTAVQGDLGTAVPVPTGSLGAAPNPFNQQAEVRFALPRAASIELQVFDVAGQLVATLAQGSYPAGVHTVIWDAATRGRDLASGVYLCRLTGAGQPVVRKVSLVR